MDTACKGGCEFGQLVATGDRYFSLMETSATAEAGVERDSPSS